MTKRCAWKLHEDSAPCGATEENHKLGWVHPEHPFQEEVISPVDTLGALPCDRCGGDHYTLRHYGDLGAQVMEQPQGRPDPVRSSHIPAKPSLCTCGYCVGSAYCRAEPKPPSSEPVCLAPVTDDEADKASLRAEVDRLKGELAEARRLLKTAPVVSWAGDPWASWCKSRDEFVTDPSAAEPKATAEPAPTNAVEERLAWLAANIGAETTRAMLGAVDALIGRLVTLEQARTPEQLYSDSIKLALARKDG